MPRPARWTCPTCHRSLGAVERDGSLTTAPGTSVTVLPATTEAPIVVVLCACGQQRPWVSLPPGFEVKAVAGYTDPRSAARVSAPRGRHPPRR